MIFYLMPFGRKDIDDLDTPKFDHHKVFRQ